MFEPVTGGEGDHSDGGGKVREIECCRCGGVHMKRYYPKRAKEKENKKKDGEDAENKRVDMMGGQLHAMFKS